MARNKRFFVFEGIDGSGKSVQTELLKKRLRRHGYRIRTMEIPQYGKKSAGLVEEYLSGKYGTAKEVGAYESSVFYAADRYDASFRINEWLKKGFTVVLDRYVGSNMGHQGGKIASPQKRKQFFLWLRDLEYHIFQIPMPAVSIFLHMPSSVALRLANNRDRRKTKKKDIHEASAKHFRDAEKAYLHAVTLFPDEFIRVECAPHGNLRSQKDIHEEIWTKIAMYL